jgi:hypothetical protein
MKLAPGLLLFIGTGRATWSGITEAGDARLGWVDALMEADTARRGWTDAIMEAEDARLGRADAITV